MKGVKRGKDGQNRRQDLGTGRSPQLGATQTRWPMSCCGTYTYTEREQAMRRCANIRTTPSWPGEGATHGKRSPGNSALLKTLQPPRLCPSRLQKGTFLHLAPPKALHGPGAGRTAVHYAGNAALPREPACVRALSSLPAGTCDLLWAFKEIGLGFPQLPRWSQDGTELSASLKLPEGTSGGGLCWSVCGFLFENGPSESTTA